MDRDDVVDAVHRRAETDSSGSAAAVTRATLATLGERVSAGEAEDLAACLPGGLADAVGDGGDEDPPGFPVEEFLDRVRERADGAADGDTEARVVAVTAAIAEAGCRNELSVAREQLPHEYAALFDTANLEG